jgi:hypothetical protein
MRYPQSGFSTEEFVDQGQSFTRLGWFLGSMRELYSHQVRHLHHSRG